MTPPSYSFASKEDRRLQAVMAMFRGERAAEIATTFGIPRSDLYKFRKRALAAMRNALADHPRGPKRAHNRLSEEREAKVVSLCERYPTWSSYKVRKRLGDQGPDPRTIQRVRARHDIARIPKRAPPLAPTPSLAWQHVERARQLITQKWHLGPERISWDLQNGEGIRISPSTIKRLTREIYDAEYPAPPPPQWRFYERKRPHSLWHGDFMEKVTLTDLNRTAYQLTLLDDYSRGYVFCDLFLYPDVRTTIHALIAAMRTAQVIPEAVVFDNAQQFRGNFASAFCKNLGIRLIHSTVRHPQTNGKLERAFRDDMKDFYRQYDQWILEPLRRDLPEYVHYRNHVRGHRALGGRPSITRLREQTRFAPPELLARLESYACHEVKRKSVSPQGMIPLFSRNACVGMAWASTELAFVETLDGLEARIEEQSVGILKDWWTIRKLSSWERKRLPPILYFEPYEKATRPRMAVA
jgi:transposase InsO family protein